MTPSSTISPRGLPVIRKQQEKHPWSKNPAAHARQDRKLAESAMANALLEFYNPAQLWLFFG